MDFTNHWYPTGQNNSFELMFATAKNCEKFNPLKVSTKTCICLKTTLKMCKIVLQVFPQLGFEPPNFQFQVRRSMPALQSSLFLYPKMLTLFVNIERGQHLRKIFVPCNLNSCRVILWSKLFADTIHRTKAVVTLRDCRFLFKKQSLNGATTLVLRGPVTQSISNQIQYWCCPTVT